MDIMTYEDNIPSWRFQITEPMCDHQNARHSLADGSPLWNTDRCRYDTYPKRCGEKAEWFKPRKGHPKPISIDKPGTLSYQIGGDHYKKMVIEPWQIFDAHPQLTHYECSTIKYILREKEGQDRVTELKKAIHHLEHQVELEERGEK